MDHSYRFSNGDTRNERHPSEVWNDLLPQLRKRKVRCQDESKPVVNLCGLLGV